MNQSPEWTARMAAWLADDSSAISLPGSPGVEALVDWLDKHDLNSLVVDLTAVQDKPTLMHAFQQDLQWPDWFGANWDALADLLMGGEASDARHNVLVLINPAALMAGSSDTTDILMSLVEELSGDPHSLLSGAILIASDVESDGN